MNIPDVRNYITPVNLTVGGIVLIASLWGLSCAQKSCGVHHETIALVSGVQADDSHKREKELEQQLAGKNVEIAQKEASYHHLNALYEAARKKTTVAPLPAPVTESGLTQAVVALGMGHDTQVQVGVPSVLNTVDATLVFNLDQQAKKVASYQEALEACDGALKASEAIQKAQEEGLKLSANALHQSEAEASARQTQVNELTKSLKVEKAKGWQKYAWGAAGVAATLLIKK